MQGEQTKDPSNQSVSKAETLHKDLETTFGSFTQFKHAFSSSALGMSGSGYMWLVMDNHRQLGIVGTYGAGTILVQSRRQRGEYNTQLPQDFSSSESTDSPSRPEEEETSFIPLDPFSSFSPSRKTETSATQTRFQSPRDTIATLRSTTNEVPKGSKGITNEIHPLFCVSMHEHCWLGDYGVWGQEDYLANFWSVLDWRNIGNVHSRLTQGSAL